MGELFRHIIAKAVLSIIGTDIQRATDPLQLCAGHTSGVEAAIYSMSTVFAEEKSEGILLVDVCHSMIRWCIPKLKLWNITFLINTANYKPCNGCCFRSYS